MTDTDKLAEDAGFIADFICQSHGPITQALDALDRIIADNAALRARVEECPVCTPDPVMGPGYNPITDAHGVIANQSRLLTEAQARIKAADAALADAKLNPHAAIDKARAALQAEPRSGEGE